MSVAGEVTIVTGGSRGIGRAIVLEPTASGVKVAFTYHTQRKTAQPLYHEVKAQGGETVGFQQGATDSEGVKVALAELVIALVTTNG